MDIESHFPTASPIARIPARTRRQAMDWSLVLASQGIEPVIEEAADGRWVLVVATEDYKRSLDSIRQYRRENLRWPWRKPLFRSRTVFDWGSTAWVLLTGLIYWLSLRHPLMHRMGDMNGEAVSRGEWWRGITATLLHADDAHLAANGVFGFLLLGLAMGRYGTGVGLLAALLAGLAGNVVSWLVHGPTFHGLGASGVVMGGLGLVSVQSFSLLGRGAAAWKLALAGTAGGLMLFVLLGLSPGTDVVAHLGGFTAGLGLGLLLNMAGDWTHSPAANTLAGLVFTALVALSWARALG